MYDDHCDLCDRELLDMSKAEYEEFQKHRRCAHCDDGLSNPIPTLDRILAVHFGRNPSDLATGNDDLALHIREHFTYASSRMDLIIALLPAVNLADLLRTIRFTEIPASGLAAVDEMAEKGVYISLYGYARDLDKSQ